MEIQGMGTGKQKLFSAHICLALANTFHHSSSSIRSKVLYT